jgi:hypothetical protein
MVRFATAPGRPLLAHRCIRGAATYSVAIGLNILGRYRTNSRHYLVRTLDSSVAEGDVYSRVFTLLAAIAVAICVSRDNAFSKPQLTSAEQQTYQEMLKVNLGAAHAYMDTRNHVSSCLQDLKQPSRILEIGVKWLRIHRKVEI